MLYRLLAGALALAGALVVALPAQARHHHHVRHLAAKPIACQLTGAGGSWVIPGPCAQRLDKLRQMNEQRLRQYRGRSYGAVATAPATPGGVGPRPRAWCGWYARQLVGQDPGPSYNLARNWAHWGHAASPGPGVMVVWPHHVGMITGRAADGQWIVKSGNDGHQVRERPRSIRGAIAFRAG